MTMKFKRLEFKYCECGCHGHEASLGPCHFWLDNDLNGTFTLRRGHGCTGLLIGKFLSSAAAEREANKIVQAELKKLVKS